MTNLFARKRNSKRNSQPLLFACWRALKKTTPCCKTLPRHWPRAKTSLRCQQAAPLLATRWVFSQSTGTFACCSIVDVLQRNASALLLCLIAASFVPSKIAQSLLQWPEHNETRCWPHSRWRCSCGRRRVRSTCRSLSRSTRKPRSTDGKRGFCFAG